MNLCVGRTAQISYLDLTLHTHTKKKIKNFRTPESLKQYCYVFISLFRTESLFFFIIVFTYVFVSDGDQTQRPRQEFHGQRLIETKMEVCVSGCVFSSLVYELENSQGDVVSGSFMAYAMI